MVLPEVPEKCSKQDLILYLQSFAGNTGRGTGLAETAMADLIRTAHAMLALEETNPTAARACRQDPNGHGTGWYLERLNLGEHAMDLPQVKGGPEDESYVFNNLFAVESHTPQVIPCEVLKAWKTRVAPEDCRAELSDNVRERVLQKVKQLPLSMTGCEIALSEGQRGDGRIWYRGRVMTTWRAGGSICRGCFEGTHGRIGSRGPRNRSVARRRKKLPGGTPVACLAGWPWIFVREAATSSVTIVPLRVGRPSTRARKFKLGGVYCCLLQSVKRLPPGLILRRLWCGRREAA